MSITVEQFAKRLVRSRLATSQEATALLKEAREKKLTAQTFAASLVRTNRLTRYQAKCIYHGEYDHLMLGNYLVLEQIGAGGMGLVFKGLHRRMKRLVALKILPPSVMTTAETIGRFQREVEAAARLYHPHIVTAHDADEEHGIHYLVMEYVDGRDLAPRNEHDIVAPQVAANYVLQAAKALEYAHNQGIVHRDIKPSNLLVDARGVVKILDMGLARFDEAAVEEDPQNVPPPLTRAGEIMGTVDFMSPEQAEDFRRADARSDIYSLGCTFHCLLFARPPYQGDTILRKLLAHREHPLPSLRERNPEIPAELDRIFQTMIAKGPQDRFQTATDLILALESAGANESAGRDHDDPYLDWLGVPPEALPPNDYELLGLPVFENDAARIRIGYQRQMGRIRPHLDGPRSADALRLLEELAQAHRRLSNPVDKEAYDHELLGDVGEAGPAPHPVFGVRRPDTVVDSPTTRIGAATPTPSAAASPLTDNDEDYQLKELPEDETVHGAAASADTRAPTSLPGERIRVTCSCGKRLIVRRDQFGKRLTCPACRQRVPSPAPAKKATPLEAVCSCGQRYHARPDLAGKTVRCLRCGAPFAVPQAP